MSQARDRKRRELEALKWEEMALFNRGRHSEAAAVRERIVAMERPAK